jgi:hypothetical protein
MVQLIDSLPEGALTALLLPYGLRVEWITNGQAIPGSHWGESEAGLVEDRLYVRLDTPVHSALHEACHFICMDDARRAELHTDAGGIDLEECAVCYLQILLADRLKGYSRELIFSDMDAWGYSFRLGSARAWYEGDADDARRWLEDHQLIPK